MRETCPTLCTAQYDMCPARAIEQVVGLSRVPLSLLSHSHPHRGCTQPCSSIQTSYGSPVVSCQPSRQELGCKETCWPSSGGRGWNNVVLSRDAQPNLCISTASFSILNAWEKLFHCSSADVTLEEWGPKEFWGIITCVKTPATAWKIDVNQ